MDPDTNIATQRPHHPAPAEPSDQDARTASRS